MFGLMAAAVFGLCVYVFKRQNFYECYLSSTMFLFWWTVGAGLSAFILRRILPGVTVKICDIFHLSKIPQRISLRKEILFSFFALFLIGAAYLLYSSLGGIEGLRYWDDIRLVSGIAMYCAALFIRSFIGFRKTRP